MKFLLVATLATVAIVLASKSGRAQRYATPEGHDHADDDQDFAPRRQQGQSLYNEPAALTIPERRDGAFDRENRPEYASEERPQLEVDALRRESNRNS